MESKYTCLFDKLGRQNSHEQLAKSSRNSNKQGLSFISYSLLSNKQEQGILKCIYFLCRFWCSTKVDNQLEHVGGQGNWGFCRQSCPPIALVTTTPKPIITTASEVSKAASKGDFLKLL